MANSYITVTQSARVLGVPISVLTTGLTKSLPKYKAFPKPKLIGRRKMYDKALVLKFKETYQKGYKVKYTEHFNFYITPEQIAAIKENGGSKWLRQLIDNAINKGE